MQGTYPARADVVFNLSTGAISSAATAFSGFASASATIAPAANGFYLVTITATTDAVTSVTGFYSFNSNGVVVDGTDSVTNSAGYIWQADLQAGSFATSPIPTTSVAVTRAADVGIINPFNNSSAYSVVASGSSAATANTYPIIAQLGDAVSANFMQLYLATQNPTRGGLRVTVGTVDQMNSPSANNIADRSLITVASSIQSGAYALSFNGGAIATGTGTVPPTNRLFVGSVAGQYFNGPIRRVVIYPRAMSNAELQAITTAGAY